MSVAGGVRNGWTWQGRSERSCQRPAPGRVLNAGAAASPAVVPGEHSARLGAAPDVDGKGRRFVTALPYEIDEPPVDPPAECVNRLMWQLARRLFVDHRPGPDGWCL